MRRFAAGFLCGVVSLYVAAYAAVWRHLTHTRRVP